MDWAGEVGQTRLQKCEELVSEEERNQVGKSAGTISVSVVIRWGHLTDAVQVAADYCCVGEKRCH